MMGSRVVKPKEKHHVFQIRSDHGDDVILVGSGKRAYLWAGAKPQHGCTTVSGPATLRALAKAILKEVGNG